MIPLVKLEKKFTMDGCPMIPARRSFEMGLVAAAASDAAFVKGDIPSSSFGADGCVKKLSLFSKMLFGPSVVPWRLCCVAGSSARCKSCSSVVDDTVMLTSDWISSSLIQRKQMPYVLNVAH